MDRESIQDMQMCKIVYEVSHPFIEAKNNSEDIHKENFLKLS